MFTSLFAVFLLSMGLVQAGSTAEMRRSHWLSAHNRNRDTYNADPLKYGPSSLTNSAQTVANKCVFQHSGGNYGENLAYYASSPSPSVDFKKHAMQPWMDEASNNGGHFTQVVWKSTEQVSCAAASCPKGTISKYDAIFYVCQYLPPGNVRGQYDENVEGYSSRTKRSLKEGENWGISAMS